MELVVQSDSENQRHQKVSVLFPATECLFCEKRKIQKKGKKEELVKFLTKTAEDSIKKAANKTKM